MNDDYDIDVYIQPIYMEDQSDPNEDRYVFSYNVTIENSGGVPVRLLSRHWIITDANGRKKEIQGKGVVGEQPHLEPGESFRYTSWAMLETPIGCMHGSYHLVTDSGDNFEKGIPAFTLTTPNQLH